MVPVGGKMACELFKLFQDLVQRRLAPGQRARHSLLRRSGGPIFCLAEDIAQRVLVALIACRRRYTADLGDQIVLHTDAGQDIIPHLKMVEVNGPFDLKP